MKRFNTVLSILILIGLTYFSFYSLMPKEGSPASISETQFSTERARAILKEISKAPHYVGTPEHERVKNYLIDQLKKLELEVEVQEGFVLNSKWGGLTKPKNILSRIKGKEKGKALLLLSHYDSAPTPSLGASDAGSGIVTILESVRAYKASGKTPKNDIIILFTDAEELGLDGASLFVNEHPWAKEVGLVLNFESRGSGGPSNMIVETNGGNKNLINAFMNADLEYPVASSLMYSIYKMLPNDTDSTVFREEGDIDGFFFAFIDDHYDYHTANDTFENLDENTLQHQGDYLLPLLHYFSEADLSKLKSDEDYVYVNVPALKMISYPFSWVTPMFIIAVVLFLLLIFYGIARGNLIPKNVIKGFVPFVLSLILNGAIGYFGWELLLKIYPNYNEIQHGFTYNGHSYIAFFVFLSLGITFYCYNRLGKKIPTIDLLIAPLFFWLVINGVIAAYLKGAAYFIIPVYFGLLLLALLIRNAGKKKTPNLLILSVLTAPAIFLLAPLVQFFPIGLGLKMLAISGVFSVLIFGLLLPVIGNYRKKRTLSVICYLIAFGFLLNAHWSSDFNGSRKKPNSLIFYQDIDKGNSFWLSYDLILDDWTREYLGNEPEDASKYIENVSGSKYKKNYSFAKKTAMKDISEFKVTLNRDTIINDSRNVVFTIHPQRRINQINLYANNELSFTSFAFNGISVPKDSAGTVYGNRENDDLIRYTVTDNDSLEVSYTIQKDKKVVFSVLEYSFDLLQHPKFSMAERSDDMMPKPFIVNDAVVLKKAIEIDSLKREEVIDPLIVELK